MRSRAIAGFGLGRALLCAAFALGCSARAAASPVTLYDSFAGNINFVTSGATLRTADDATNPCSVTTGPVNLVVSGIPASSTVTAAYLYWAGSGSTADTAVTFNGTGVTADRTFTETFSLGGTDYDFFAGFEDVTSLVSGNGTYTFNNLAVSTGGPWCGVSAVLSGAALVVVYSNASEDFRVINVFDGLQQYRGSSITLTPNNFQVPVSPINGKFAIVTWEGDVGNSASLGGFTENITFNGSALTDAANPTNNQFNSTINTVDANNDKYGVDVDTYTVDAYLSANDTSATTVYSSGGDLVLLTAEIISVTNVPTSDLAITKSHVGNFTVNTNGSYTLTVTNNGPSNTTGTTTVTDTLPAGLDYVSATGTGWSCSFSSPDVTCTRSDVLTSGASYPPITLTVSVANGAFPSVTNTATVAGGNFDNDAANSTASDPTTVNGADLSTSTKTVSDLNGGDADPGDTLRYTITLNNTSTVAATAVSVTDDIPPSVTGFSVVSTPAGSTNSSTGGGTGANGTGYLNVTGITVPGSGSTTVVFDVTIAGTASPGDTIDNTATVNAPGGVDATPSAPTVTVSGSQVPASGNKRLYLYNSGGLDLSRNQPGSGTQVAVVEGTSQNWTMTPASAAAITISGTVSVQLVLTETGNGSSRTIEVRLADSASPANYATATRTITLSGTPTAYTFNLTGTGGTGLPATLASGRSYRLTVLNQTTGSGSRDIEIYPFSGATYSYVQLPATTVINVDSVISYDAAYAGGATPVWFEPGETVYVRAVVSDPFGSFDITGATVTIDDPGGTTVVNGAAMTEVADSGTLTKTYEYAYVVPANGPGGYWDATVVASEGAEGTVTDTGVGTFRVVLEPDLTIAKSSSVLSDPVNGGTNPKRIPGGVVRYSILVTNSGIGSPDASTLVITDPVPANTRLCVSTTCTGGADPVEFVDGTPSSALTYTYASHVSYSNQVGGGAPYTYTPTPDANGYDANVTGVRIAPAGTMAPSTGAPHPSFTFRFRVQVK